MIGIYGAMDMKRWIERANILGGNPHHKRDGFLSGISQWRSCCSSAESGVGKVNAAMCAQMVLQYQTLMIISSGRGLAKGYVLAMPAISSGLVEHDFDLTIFGEEKG